MAGDHELAGHGGAAVERPGRFEGEFRLCVNYFFGDRSRTSTEVPSAERLWAVETNLDDISGELIGYCTTLLWEAGALDVYTTAIGMKTMMRSRIAHETQDLDIA